MNTEIYGVNLGIQSECGKMPTRKNYVSGHFSRSDTLKQKQSQTKEEKRNTKETKKEKEKENVVVNSICGKSNVI